MIAYVSQGHRCSVVALPGNAIGQPKTWARLKSSWASCLGPQLIWTDNIDWRETIKYPDCVIDGLWPEFDVGTFCPWVGDMQHNLRGQLGNSLDLLMVRSYTTELEVQYTLKVVDANRLLSVWYVFIVNDSSLAKASRRDLLLMVSAA